MKEYKHGYYWVKLPYEDEPTIAQYDGLWWLFGSDEGFIIDDTYIILEMIEPKKNQSDKETYDFEKMVKKYEDAKLLHININKFSSSDGSKNRQIEFIQLYDQIIVDLKYIDNFVLKVKLPEVISEKARSYSKIPHNSDAFDLNVKRAFEAGALWASGLKDV